MGRATVMASGGDKTASTVVEIPLAQMVHMNTRDHNQEVQKMKNNL